MRICNGNHIRIACKNGEILKILDTVENQFSNLYKDIELIKGNKIYFRITNNREYGFSGKEISAALHTEFPGVMISYCCYENGECSYSVKW